MKETFKGTKFNQDISAWDTSASTGMVEMFEVASAFNQDIGGWDVTKVNGMSNMLKNADAFDRCLNWKQASGAFWHLAFACYPFDADPDDLADAVDEWLDEADVAEVKYGPIGRWDTSRVTSMRALFCGSSHDYCIRFNAEGKSFNEDISAWDTSQVTDMYATFGHADAFDQNIGGWDTARVTTMFAMFWGRSTPLDATVKAFDQNIGGWDTARVTTMFAMFWGRSDGAVKAFNQPIGAWDVSKVTTMKDMFAFANSFDQDISAWETSQVSSRDDMFWDCPIRDSYKPSFI